MSQMMQKLTSNIVYTVNGAEHHHHYSVQRYTITIPMQGEERQAGRERDGEGGVQRQ